MNGDTIAEMVDSVLFTRYNLLSLSKGKLFIFVAKGR